jgi:hypothetical protein
MEIYDNFGLRFQRQDLTDVFFAEHLNIQKLKLEKTQLQ